MKRVTVDNRILGSPTWHAAKRKRALLELKLLGGRDLNT